MTTDGLLGWLRSLDRDGLAEVLAHRPDVLLPPWPRRLDEVAARLASPSSLEPAILSLPAPHLQVVHAAQLCYALGCAPAPVADVAELLGTTTSIVESFVDELTARALAWRIPDGIVLHDSLHNDGYSVHGLGRSVADLIDHLTVPLLARLSDTLGLPAEGRRKELLNALVSFYRDTDGLRELIATAPEPVQRLLRDIAFAGPEIDDAPPQGAAAWAYERALLLTTYSGGAYMPLEVSLAVRGPEYHLPFTPDEPEYPVTDLGAEAVEAASSAAALRLLDRVTAILDLAAAEPLPLLKNGTIGARLVKKLAKDTGGTAEEIELALDLTARTGLLMPDEPEEPPARRGRKAPPPPPPALVPNPELPRPEPASCYRLLLTSWWELEVPEFFFSDGPDVGGQVRQTLLRLLARLDPGTGVTDVEALTRLVAWHSPMIEAEDVGEYVRRALADGELIGATASGAATAAGRALLQADPARLAEVTGELIARARTTALFGTDLTAIVPGSPDAGLAALLDRAADRESQGTATSWRFSPASVRRAFDQGATAGELLRDLRAVAAAELPQPLVYLVEDVARRHGEARVIDVASVVVGDEPAVLAEIAAHRKLAKLGLRAVAPTVLTSTVDAAGTLEALRAAGYAPTRHAADGSIVVPARDQAPPVTVDHGTAPAAEPVDPRDHAERLLAAPPTGPGLRRGQVAAAISNRYGGRLTAVQQQLCRQLEAGMPIELGYRENGAEPTRLVVAYPELDGDVLDVWSLDDNGYRRLDLKRVELG